MCVICFKNSFEYNNRFLKNDRTEKIQEKGGRKRGKKCSSSMHLSSSSHGTFKFIILNIFFTSFPWFSIRQHHKKKPKGRNKRYDREESIHKKLRKNVMEERKKNLLFKFTLKICRWWRKEKKVQPDLCMHNFVIPAINWESLLLLPLETGTKNLRPLQVLVFFIFSIFFDSFVDCLNMLLFTFCSCVWMSECWMHYAPAKHIMKHPNHLLAAFYRSVFFFTSFHFVSST